MKTFSWKPILSIFAITLIVGIAGVIFKVDETRSSNNNLLYDARNLSSISEGKSTRFPFSSPFPKSFGYHKLPFSELILRLTEARSISKDYATELLLRNNARQDPAVFAVLEEQLGGPISVNYWNVTFITQSFALASEKQELIFNNALKVSENLRSVKMEQ